MLQAWNIILDVHVLDEVKNRADLEVFSVT